MIYKIISGLNGHANQSYFEILTVLPTTYSYNAHLYEIIIQMSDSDTRETPDIF